MRSSVLITDGNSRTSCMAPTFGRPQSFRFLSGNTLNTHGSVGSYGKNPQWLTLPGIDPDTVRLVAQRLNHYATPGPGGILILYIYITRLASNEIFSPSNKIHREVDRAKDLSAPCVHLQLKIKRQFTDALGASQTIFNGTGTIEWVRKSMIKLSNWAMTQIEAILSNNCTVTWIIGTKVIETGTRILNVFCHCKQNIAHLKYLLLNEMFIINSKTNYFRTYAYMTVFLCSDMQNSHSVQAF